MKIVFFSVHAAIWPHALPENRLVNELRNAGHDITYVTCNRAFHGHCTSMSAFGYEPSLPPERKDEVCRSCLHSESILTKGNRARHIHLSSYLTEADEQAVEELAASVSADAYLGTEWNGVPIGKIATYELFLKYKKMSTVLVGEEWDYYQIYLKNSMRSGLAFDKILHEIKPDVVFFYSPQYAVNGVAAALAAKHGATPYFLEGSSNNAERYQALRVWDWSKNGLLNPALLHWAEAERRVSENDVARIKSHFDELFAGKSFAAYSSPRTAEFSSRAFFAVPQGAKLLLATLSSFDEAFAAVMIDKFPASKLKSEVFENQFEWIEKTFAYIDGREDIFLIVRVHPRDYPNKRESVQSEQAAHWERVLEKRPRNVAINWPQQNISLYNIFSDIDGLLTGWSATGVEALAFGIPVVTYDRGLPSYPAEIHMTGRSEPEYYANIERALQAGRSPENAVAAFKWLAITFSMGTVIISREYWADKALAFAKRHLKLKPETLAKLDAALLRYHARQPMPFRRDAARFRALVTSKAPDLIGVAVKQRPPLSAAAISRKVMRQLRKLRFAEGNR
jgi:hypothetical protein